MRIDIGSDRAGKSYRERIARYLERLGTHEIVDHGTATDDPVDYPDYAAAVARSVASGVAARGILVCGSGIGVCMTANRYEGVRAANCSSVEMAELAREHNDANVLCLGERLIDYDVVEPIIDAFLSTPASDEPRHRRRVEKIDTVVEQSRSR